MRAVDFPACFRAAGALPFGVAFEDNGAVEQVAPHGQMQVFRFVGLEAQRLHGREFIDGCEDVGWEVLGWFLDY